MAIALVTALNVGAPNGVAPLNASGVVPINKGGTGTTSLPAGALTSNGTSISGGVVPVVYGGTGVTTSTGTGKLVLSNSPALTGGTIDGATIGAVTPVSIVASSIDVQSLTVAGVSTTTATGTGSLVLSTNAVLVAPNLGTPSALTLTNATGLSLSAGTVGVLPVTKGGTGVTTLTGLVKGNGTGVFTAAVAGTDFLSPTLVGQPNGLATLDGSGRIPVGQIPTALIGALNYQGTWNAATNTPTLATGVGTKGYYFKVSVTGSTSLDGITQWNVGDLAIYDGSSWGKVDGVADQVLSVNGQTGVVSVTRASLSAAASGVNSDITSLTGLTVPLSAAQGGTGTTTATGTGSLVLSTNAVLVTPNLGTPSALTLTNATGLSLATGVIGTLAVGRGGTGATTQQGALNALAGAVTSGMVLRGDGTNVAMAAIMPADIPTLNQNTTGSAGSATSVTGAAQPLITSLGTLTSLTVAGSVSISGGASPVYLSGSAGTAGQVLTSGGPGVTPTWTTVSGGGGGGVTSVQASGGTTGLTFSGGPVTSTGTLTLGGVLAVANGGTGVTTGTGTGAVVHATDADLTGTTTAQSLEIAGALNLVGAPVRLMLDNDPGSNGQILSSGGSLLPPKWITVTGTGTVTSVEASGGSTGLSFTGGPVTAAGTLTLDGVLAIEHGGTGTTIGSGSGPLVHAENPEFWGALSINGKTVAMPNAYLEVPGTDVHATSGVEYAFVNAAASELKLPYNPKFGQSVSWLNLNGRTDNVARRNGSLINGSPSDVTLDLPQGALRYINDAVGWVGATSAFIDQAESDLDRNIAMLFRDRLTDGFIYDASDFSTLDQDTLGTTPVTTVEQTVQRVLDKSGRSNHMVNAAGATVGARINMMVKSEQFGDASWTTGKTVGANVTSDTTVAPDGTTTADTLIFAAGSDHLVHTVSGVIARVGAAVDLTYRAKTSARLMMFAGASLAGTDLHSVTAMQGGYYLHKTTRTFTADATGVLQVWPTGSIVGAGSYVAWGAEIRPSKQSGVPYQSINTATDYNFSTSPKYLAFNGSSNFLTCATAGGGNKAFYLACALRALSVGTDRVIFSDAGSNTGYIVLINSSDKLEIRGGNGSSYTSAATAENMVVNNASVIQVADDGIDFSAQIDDGPIVKVARPAVTSGTAGFTMFRNNGSASGFFHGELYGAVYLKNLAPSISERASIYASLKEKAGF